MFTYIILNALLQYLKKIFNGSVQLGNGLSKRPSLTRICVKSCTKGDQILSDLLAQTSPKSLKFRYVGQPRLITSSCMCKLLWLKQAWHLLDLITEFDWTQLKNEITIMYKPIWTQNSISNRSKIPTQNWLDNPNEHLFRYYYLSFLFFFLYVEFAKYSMNVNHLIL